MFLDQGTIGRVLTDGDVVGTGVPPVVESPSGSISRIQIGGDLLGDLSAPNGTILRVEVTGDIGSPASLVSISANGRFAFAGPIQLISASSIYADIDIPGDAQGQSELRRLETTGATSAGDFVGSLNVGYVGFCQPGDLGISILGDLDADIDLTSIADRDIIVGGTFLPGRFVRYGTRLGVNPDKPQCSGFTARFIVLAPQGLQGQVIVNASDTFGEWLDNVEIGTGAGQVILGPSQAQPDQAPFYDRLSADLGGGAVGVVPFNVHPRDSEPDLSATLATPPDEVRIRHYGPIYGDGTGQVLLIERSGDGGQTWSDVSNQFSVAVDTSPTTFSRLLVVTPKVGQAFQAASMYRFNARPALRCANVPGNPSVVYRCDNTSNNCYEFTIQ